MVATLRATRSADCEGTISAQALTHQRFCPEPPALKCTSHDPHSSALEPSGVRSGGRLDNSAADVRERGAQPAHIHVLQRGLPKRDAEAAARRRRALLSAAAARLAAGGYHHQRASRPAGERVESRLQLRHPVRARRRERRPERALGGALGAAACATAAVHCRAPRRDRHAQSMPVAQRRANVSSLSLSQSRNLCTGA